MAEARLDEVGYWTEVKLDIVREYAAAYSRILLGPKSKKAGIRGHLYVDAFAGAGSHVSRRSGGVIPGTPKIALDIDPPFTEYHFIDLSGERVLALAQLAEGRPDVYLYEADCNAVLVNRVFPRARWEDRRRALCLLDPYGLDLRWKVVSAAGGMKSIEVFLNFPLMDMNRNVLWHDPEKVSPAQVDRMNAFWGDESWRHIAYPVKETLFGPQPRKASNEIIAKAFQDRLRSVAGFTFVPDPMPMRNTKGAVVYYLFFASPNPTGAKIIGDIFNKYRDYGG